jgi:hypothetical protein
VGSDDPDSESAAAAVEALVLSFRFSVGATELSRVGDTNGGLLAGWVVAYDLDSSESLSPQRTSQPVSCILAGAPTGLNEPGALLGAVRGF